MDWGLENRLAKMFRPDTGKSVMLAVDHGYFQGPTTGLEDVRKTITPLLTFCDALSPTRGVLRNCVDPKTTTPIILRVSGGNSMARPDELDDEIITTSIEDAIRLNAVCVSVSIYVGSPHQRQTIENLSRVINEANRYGIPVLGIVAVGRDLDKLRQPGMEDEFRRYLGLACRIAAEIGSHIVKAYYCKGFEKVVRGCPVPIVIAGGKKVEEEEALQFTSDAIRDGAKGMDMGRNIFQSENPVAMIKAVRAIVHENKTSKEAYEMYKSLGKK